MSRIAGIIYPSAFQSTEMINEMHSTYPSPHRFQYFHHKNLELGAWNSEMASNERRDIWALLDGHIYNKDELKKELKDLGYTFFSEKESEILVHAYDAWKMDFLKRLNGPFALALFDEQNEILILGRDRLGQKPLYWSIQREYWFFSTELKGLVATGIVPQTPSATALASYLYFGFIPQDLSPIQGVNKLLPCHYLKVNLNRQSIIGQYWSLSEHLQTNKKMSKEDTYNELGKRLEDAIRISLPEKGKVGSFLVGNLGSSTMTWFLSHLLPRERIQTYCAVFDEPEPYELNKSAEIAAACSLGQITKKIRPQEVIEELPKIIWNLDEPIADPFIIQTWYLGKLASGECRYAYADLGWEEILGGNSRYFLSKDKKTQLNPPLAFHLASLPNRMRNHLLFPLLRLIRCKYLYRILRNIDINRQQVNYLMQAALFKGKVRKKISPMLYPFFDPEIFSQRFHHLNLLPDSISPSLYYDAKTELPDRLLIQFERLLTPHQVSVINPFLDFRLVDFIAEIPEEIKFETHKPGAILHQLMNNLCHACPPFPERKGSFMDTWCHDGNFREIFHSLAKGRLVEEGIISGRWIKQQLGYPYLIPENFNQLWALLILEIWFQMYISFPINISNSNLSLKTLLQYKI